MSLPTYTLPPEQQQSRRPRRFIWIIVGVSIGAFLILGGITAIVAYREIQDLKQNGTIPERYILSMIGRDYATAYSYLDSQATINGQPVANQQTFTAMATAADNRDGTAMGAEVENTSPDQTHVTINLHRGKRTYVIHLVLKLEGSSWEIISADSL